MFGVTRCLALRKHETLRDASRTQRTLLWTRHLITPIRGSVQNAENERRKRPILTSKRADKQAQGKLCAESA